jgi:hypothetical protein
VQRPVLVDQAQNTVNQSLSFVVAKLTQGGLSTQVFVVVGVAARTPQRTLTRDLNRQRRVMPRQNPAPRPE